MRFAKWIETESRSASLTLSSRDSYWTCYLPWALDLQRESGSPCRAENLIASLTECPNPFVSELPTDSLSRLVSAIEKT